VSSLLKPKVDDTGGGLSIRARALNQSHHTISHFSSRLSHPYRKSNTKGLYGEGVTILLMDSGFDLSHVAFSKLRVLDEYDFVFVTASISSFYLSLFISHLILDLQQQKGDNVTHNQEHDVPGQHNHGTATLSILAANAPGFLIGAAPGASFLVCHFTNNKHHTKDSSMTQQCLVGQNRELR